MPRPKVVLKIGIVLVAVVSMRTLGHAQWSNLTNAMPNNNPDTCLLLTDGTAMCHEYSTNHWHRLVPDPFGSYQNGTWDPVGKTIADMPNGVDSSGSCNAPAGCTYAPLYFASAVLPDGRVVVIGGEDNPGTANNMVETNIGFMYDPTTNTWSSQLTEQFGTGNVGDEISVILQNGQMMIGDINGTTSEIFDPATLTFNLLNDTGKIDSSSEEAYTILPGVQGAPFPLNGRVLAVNTSKSNSFQIYDPTANTWSASATTAGLDLPDNGPNCPGSSELGPTVGLPNGTIIQFSGGESGKNAIYDINAGTWSENTNLDFKVDGSGNQLSVEDGPASLLPNGHALVMASPACNSTNKTSFNAPSHIFEWDGTTLNEVTTSGIGFANAGSYDSYQGRMLLLPTGDVLVLGNNQKGTTTVQLYTGAGGPQDTWRPVITSAPNSIDPSNTYTISGQQFNGFSMGATYGDNAQMATNYPLVRFTSNATGHVFYSRTHDHSRMGLEAVGDTETLTTNFDTSSSAEISGLGTLEVVTNGIPSKTWTVNGPGLSIPGPLSMNTCLGSTATTTLNVCNTGKQDLTISNISSSDPQFSAVNPGYTLTVSPNFCFPVQVNYAPSGYGTTSATLTIDSNDTNHPQEPVQVTGTSPAPSINATIASGGSFGNVCPGSAVSINLNVTNQGQCNLKINSIVTSSNFLPPSTTFPLVLTADATVALPITFAPGASQACSNTAAISGAVDVFSNDPVTPDLHEVLGGVVPCPHINSTFANSGSYGNVCAGTHEDLNLQLLNAGQCNLNISSITSSNSTGFVLPAGTTYPLVLSADANVNIPVRFVPSGVCSNTVPETSTITVNSNDPGGPLTQAVSGIEGCPIMVLSPQNLTGVFAYPATVSDPTGTLGCYTDRQITVGNSGICPLNITSLTTSNGSDGLGLPLPATPLEYKVVSPTVPISIAPGAAPVPITVRFKPLILTDQNPTAPDQQTGSLTITSNDPVPADNTAGLCGEPTYHSGARVLVVDSNSNPVSSVSKLTLSSKGLKPGFSETLMPAPVRAGAACGNAIYYHLDKETLKPAGTTGNNPLASYVLSAKEGSTSANMSFTLGQCQMQQIVLQIK